MIHHEKLDRFFNKSNLKVENEIVFNNEQQMALYYPTQIMNMTII